MGLLEFDKLPINTLVGADWDTFRKVTARQQIDKGFKGKYRLTTGVCRLLSALKPIEDSRFKKLADKPLEMDPLFILGHWRSGTTFVHNIFACDKHFGYTTTYQTVFPHLMLWGQPFFKKNMAFLMPDKRPTDNMELKVDLPQEEEFALSNMMPYTYYNFWFFPKRWMEYCDRYLLFNDITEEERRIFMDTFMRLVKVSLWNTNGTQYLSKNPPHTGRVKTLLEMFPNAKFIYLKRNPYTVFESTRSSLRYDPAIAFAGYHERADRGELHRGISPSFLQVRGREAPDTGRQSGGSEVRGFREDAFAMTEILRSIKLTGFKESKADIEKYLGEEEGLQGRTNTSTRIVRSGS